MITKRSIVGQISIDEFGSISIRTDIILEENGVELARSYQRQVVAADTDVSTLPTAVQPIASIVWTPAVAAAAVARRVESHKNFNRPGV